jgi:tetratricopeptide (TPR) repeat protein
MLMWMVMSVALAAAPQAGSQQTPAEPRAQAEQLARSGAYRAALQRFQALAAANPDDVDARLWIARLHSWMGHDARAVDVYESILATNPRHIDAMIGAGDALIRLGRRREAGDVLARAETAAPDNAAVLAAQGRLHAAAGHSDLALAYYQRAMTIDPSAATASDELAALVRERAHRVELGYFFEHFNVEDTPDPQAGFGTVDLRLTEDLRVSGTVQHERKFSQSETRGGAGVEWLAGAAVRIRAGALFGGDTLVLPKTDGYGGISYRRGRATWSFDLRFAEFEFADVQIGGAGLQLALPRRTDTWVRYYRFSTDYESQSSDIVHSWVLGVSGHPAPRWTIGAEYTRGPDHLEMLTIDRLGAFESNTYSTFVELLVRPMLSVHARYDYQDRPSEVRVHRAGLQLIRRF